LGNTRVTYSDGDNDGTLTVADIKQINHYYPFGLNMEGNWNGAYPEAKNKYQYNGKEWNDDFGLGLSDYGARFSDPTIGRWMHTDPEGETNEQISFSNYHYTFDNPIRFNDPDGKEGEPCCGGMLASLLGTTVSVVDNFTGSNLRDIVGDRLGGSTKDAFDQGVAIGDKGSLAAGGILIGGGGAVAAGGGTLTLTGFGATVGVPAVAVGGTAVVVGGFIAGNALNNIAKAEQNPEKSSGSKKSNVSSGNKNSSHANEKAREVAKERYDKSKTSYNELKSKANKTPTDKKQLETLKKAVDKNKAAMDNTGEPHNIKAKGNKTVKN
jgi:RHS repeat-associated protein